MLQNKISSIIVISFIALILFKGQAYSEITRDYNVKGWGKDPFISNLDLQQRIQEERRKRQMVKKEEEKEDVIKKRIRQEIEAIKLTGILKGENNLAIINQEIYQSGDEIMGKKITDIGSDYVILKQAGYSFKINIEEMKAGPSPKQVKVKLIKFLEDNFSLLEEEAKEKARALLKTLKR